MKEMNARNQAMMKIYSDVSIISIQAQYQIYKMIRQDEKFYEELLKNLMVQGLIKLFEHEVVIRYSFMKIRCLHRDIRHVKNVIDDAIEEFKGILRAELNGLEFDVTIEVDEDKCLDERILKDNSIRTV